MMTPDPDPIRTAYASLRVWCEAEFSYIETSGRVTETEAELRAMAPLVYVVDVRWL